MILKKFRKRKDQKQFRGFGHCMIFLFYSMNKKKMMRKTYVNVMLDFCWILSVYNSKFVILLHLLFIYLLGFCFSFFLLFLFLCWRQKSKKTFLKNKKKRLSSMPIFHFPRFEHEPSGVIYLDLMIIALNWTKALKNRKYVRSSLWV